MFERYTEKARRVIFFARYEASQFGSPYIETEHLLLGLLREAKEVAVRFKLDPEAIRNQIDSATVIREKVSTSVDLPLSNEGKRVLAYAAEEAERLGHKHIGAEHLFLGLLREEKSFAAELLREAGVALEQARKQIDKSPTSQVPLGGTVPTYGGSRPTPLIEFVEAGQALTVSALMYILPRAGEEIVLQFDDGPKTYRVENVRFVMVSDPHFQAREGQRLEKIQLLVKRLLHA